MSDEQTRLLEEIRDTVREHLELFRERSQGALQAQKRALRALVGFLVFLVLLFATYTAMVIWNTSSVQRMPVRIEPDFGDEQGPFPDEDARRPELPPTT